jgi:hypothetical protein
MIQHSCSEARLLGWLLLPILLAGVCGCGRTAKVSGKVTYQGRPVAYGSVIFLSADKTARSGVIEPDGSYTIEGTRPGSVSIAVISRDPSKGRSVVQGRKRVGLGKKGVSSQDTAIEGWFPLPRKFEAPETSGLSCTIASGRVTHDIDLK